MNSERTLEWQFGGWTWLPPWLGWIFLVLLAVGGVVLTVRIYGDTLRKLTWRQRLIFAGLRSAFLLALILCLAGPAWVEKTYDSNRDSRPLAVVVDRSQSMTVADSRGTTRLEYAVRVWKKVETEAFHAFPSFRYFHFSASLVPASDFDAAITAPDPGTETHLFDSLNQALKEAPAGGYGGIVCLTDGLDTTDATSEDLSRRALQNHSPLYFAVGLNHQAPQESLLVREISVPGHVLRKSQFTATMLVEAHTAHDRDVPVSLSINGQPTAQTTLHLHPGSNLVPWPVPIDTAEPGLLRLSCQVGEGTEEETVAATVPVIASEQIHILFYQGTLDWGFRFINSALSGDPSFAITGLFDPALNMTQVVTTTSQTALSDMPEKADALKPFQIVVLANAYANQLSPAQQSALLDYVHGGGGLLLLVSDNAMAQTFSGTALESVLPVVFEAPPSANSYDQSVEEFQQTMHNIGGVNFGREDEFATNAEEQNTPGALSNFALPTNSRPSEITDLFSTGGSGTIHNLPQFSTYARVHDVKAGGEVLAVHPQDKTEANEPRALLVTQRFGQGQVTTLLTDALWRWRLSLPSTVHDPEVFWQQLFLALARHSTSTEGMRFGLQPFSSALGQTCAFRVDNVPGVNAPALVAISPSGKTQSVTTAPDLTPGSWGFQITPNEPGKWRIQATGDQGALMETLLRVSSASHTNELSGLAPDSDGLRKLAQSTGGCLLNDGTPDSWVSPPTPDQKALVSKHSRPVWNSWIVLLIALGLYATELIWRRRAKLL